MGFKAAGASSSNAQGEVETNIFAFAPSIYAIIGSLVLMAKKCNYRTCSHKP